MALHNIKTSGLYKLINNDTIIFSGINRSKLCNIILCNVDNSDFRATLGDIYVLVAHYYEPNYKNTDNTIITNIKGLEQWEYVETGLVNHRDSNKNLRFNLQHLTAGYSISEGLTQPVEAIKITATGINKPVLVGYSQ